MARANNHDYVASRWSSRHPVHRVCMVGTPRYFTIAMLRDIAAS
ncbi:hypothetical protein ACRU44_16995 [Mycobacterium colombiense]